jgi:hypothetical protein
MTARVTMFGEIRIVPDERVPEGVIAFINELPTEVDEAHCREEVRSQGGLWSDYVRCLAQRRVAAAVIIHAIGTEGGPS